MSQLPPTLHGLANAIEMSAYHIAKVNALDASQVPLAMGQAFINQWAVFIMPPPEEADEEEAQSYLEMNGHVRNLLGAMLFPVLSQLERLLSDGVPINEIFEEKRPEFAEAFQRSYNVCKAFGLEGAFEGEVGQA